MSQMRQASMNLRLPNRSQYMVVKVLQGYLPINDYHHNKQAKPKSATAFKLQACLKRKWKIGRYRRKSRAIENQNETRYLLQARGISKAVLRLPWSPVLHRHALRIFVSAVRSSRFSRSMQYSCKIVSIVDIHVTFSACRSWTCCPAYPRPQSRAA
jgi:hypothetical protein